MSNKKRGFMNEQSISYTKTNTHVKDSYTVKNKQIIIEYVNWIISVRESLRYPITRSVNSYVREWQGHNVLYEKNYKIDHTKDVDLEERITISDKIKGLFLDIVWLIIGGI